MTVEVEKAQWPTENLPSQWAWADLHEIFVDATDSRKKVPQTDYLEAGRLAVVDQGANLVGGYTNDDSLQFNGSLPVVVFGDHTRCVKYLDHPFAQGADGVKVLVPAPYYDSKFGYHALKAAELPDKGYSRHFKFLKASRFPLPPLNEQKRIVAKIDALTEKSREARQALDEVPALLDQLRQSILAAAFRGDLTKKWREQNPNVEPASVLLDRIRKERRRKWEEAELAKFKAKGKVPSDNKWKAKYVEPEPVDTEGLPDLPEGWCWSSINELTLMSGGITKGQKRKAEVRTRPVPYLRVANVQRGSLSLEEMAEIEATDEQIEQLRLQPGDLLLNEGGDIDKLGRGWVWRGELETCIHQNHVFRARPVSRDLDPEFISHFTNTFGQRYFLDSGKQTTNLASVSMTRVKACPVPVAPVAETKAIVTAIRDTLKSAQSVISIHSASTEHLETLDASILAKAFRGELVPQDPNDEPAFVLLERIRKERGGEAPNKNGRKNKGKGRSPAL